MEVLYLCEISNITMYGNVRNSLKNQNILKQQRANTKYNILVFKFDNIGQ